MYFNAREYDRTNAISLIALGGAAISVVYLIFTVVAISTADATTDGSSAMTTHLTVSFVLVVTFVVASLVVTPRYERLHTIKGLIDEFLTLLNQDASDGIIRLSSESQRDIVITATRKSDGYRIYVQYMSGLHWLEVSSKGVVHFSPLDCSTEKFALTLLAYLHGDQLALRSLLRSADDTVVAP